MVIGGIILVLVVLVVVGNMIKAKVEKKIGEGIAEKMIEGATGGKVDISGLDAEKGEMTITGKDGEKVTIGGGLPKDMPKDIPVYPGSEVKGSLSGFSNKEDSSGVYLTLATKDSFDKVVAYYKAELPKQGWTVENTLDSAETAMLAVKKSDNRSGAFTISNVKDENMTTIGIMVGTDK